MAAISKKLPIQLLIIDPQNDFVDIPQGELPRVRQPGAIDDSIWWSPALPVAGAHDDMLRLGEFIRQGMRGIEDITVTLDSHHYVGIERPTFWMKADGSEVSPFTQITSQMVRMGEYLPRNSSLVNRVLSYLDALEQQQRYTLMVWPVHCEIGTVGYAVHDAVRGAYNQWEKSFCGVVQKVTKGSNPMTEHYSAFAAEVMDPADPSTQVNMSVIESLRDSMILVGGEAGSHCVKSSIEHLTQYIGDQYLSNIVLLTDCISPVAGFEAQYQNFLSDMKAKGLQTATTKDILPELIANGRR